MKTMAGIDLVHIPYKGGAPAAADLVAGHVDLMFGSSVIMPHVQADRLRLLAVTTGKRSPLLPDVPTIAESGLPGFQAVAWLGLAAPGETPRPIVEKLFSEIKGIVAAPDVQAQIGRLGMTPMQNPSVDALKQFVLAEIARWGEVVKVSGATAE
jgi:tripartite-type tricarboxylate transporter receptor subunit TctC